MINQQLLDYIRQQLKNRIDRETIKRELIVRGWSENDIYEAINFIDVNNPAVDFVPANKSKPVAKEPRIIQIFRFVLTSPQFSFLDKIEYFGFIVLTLVGITLVGHSLWKDLSFNYFGIGLLLSLLFLGPKLYRKYTLPFNQQILGEEQARKEQEGLEYATSLGQKTIIAFAKTEIYFWFLNLLSFAVILASVFILFYLKIPVQTILLVVGFEFLAWIIILIKIWRRIWKPVDALQRSRPQQFKRSIFFNPIFQILIGVAILISVLVFISYRYKAITGKNFWEGFGHPGVTVISLPKDNYVLIQIVNAEEDNLLEKNSIEDYSFSFDKSTGFLRLNLTKEYFADPKDLIMVKIAEDEISRKYGYGRYSITPISKLPLYLVTTGTDFQPRILEIDKTGTLTVEREIFDQKVAKWELKNTSKLLDRVGKVKEVVKISPNQTFDFTDDKGNKLKLIHLGIYPKSGILFLPRPIPTLPNQPSPNETITPSTTEEITPISNPNLVIENFAISEEDNWYVAKGMVKNKSEQTLQKVYIKWTLLDSKNQPFASNEELINQLGLGLIRPGEQFSFETRIGASKPYVNYIIEAVIKP